MSKSIIAALFLIILAVVVILHNGDVTKVIIAGTFSFKAKESLVFLGFFVSGIITGLLLKGK